MARLPHPPAPIELTVAGQAAEHQLRSGDAEPARWPPRPRPDRARTVTRRPGLAQPLALLGEGGRSLFADRERLLAAGTLAR